MTGNMSHDGYMTESFPLKAQPQCHEVKVKPEEDKEEEGWLEAWFRFSQSTTLHGVNKITEPSQFNIRRLLWMLVVLLGLTLFIHQMVQSVQYYLDWPVTVNVKINYNKTLTFPAVTVCNQNDFRTTATASAGLYKLVQEYYSKLREGKTDLNRHNASEITLDFLYNQTAHRKTDMIVKCEWDEHLCGEDDFQDISTDYGRCFSFNLAEMGKPLRKVQRTGADRGLRLLLNIEQYEYMLGPNPGAGIKILIHENTEIPSVRDLGHAIPPGTHAYVGIQITKVTNLKPPHGKCNDSVQLQYFRDYSVPACVQECKANFLADTCGCRDFYMNSMNVNGQPAPPVCTLEQYQNCTVPMLANEFYRPLPEGHERCDCPIACTRLMFDPTISYAATSAYDTEIYKRSNMTQRLHERFLGAREVFQRVDDHELEQNTFLISELDATTRQVAALLDNLTSDLNQMMAELEDTIRVLKIRTYFHRRWGVEKVKFIVHNDFARGWEVLDERTFSLVTIGYKEIVAYINHVVDEIAETSPEMTSLRQALFISADRDLYSKETLCDRALVNITKLEDGFINASAILTYKASPGRRYDMTWVSPEVILSVPGAQGYVNRFRQRTQQFCNASATIKDLLRELVTGNRSEANASIVDDVRRKGLDMEKAARSYNYYRFILYDRVVLATEQTADDVIAKFDEANQTMTEDFRRLEMGLRDVLGFLYKMRMSWQSMMVVNELTMRYMNEQTNKTALAELLFSDAIMDAKRSLKIYFNEARIRAHDVANDLTRFKLSVKKLWSNMLGEKSTSRFYEKLHADVTEAEVNATILEKLLHTFSYMSRKSKDEIRADLKQLDVVMNADFPVTDVAEKADDIERDFAHWYQKVDIGGSIGDLDAQFFSNFKNLDDNLRLYLEANKLDNLFFENNFLSVDVFMKELSYEEIEQQVAYDMTSLWSDIGGSMGLFIGASVITGFEFIDAIVLNCFRLYCKRHRKGATPA